MKQEERYTYGRECFCLAPSKSRFANFHEIAGCDVDLVVTVVDAVHVVVAVDVLNTTYIFLPKHNK